MTRRTAVETAVVFVGGAAGAGLREGLLVAGAGAAHPLRTVLAINVVGAFVLAALVAAVESRGADEGARRLVRLGLGTGVCGGFTTYSTFALQVLDLVPGEPLKALIYPVATVLLGVVATLAGLRAGPRVGHRRHTVTAVPGVPGEDL